MIRTGCLAAAILLLPLGDTFAGAADLNRTISVTGAGQILATPSIATVIFGVTTRRNKPSEAFSDNAAAAAKVIEKMKSLGVASQDIQTSGLGLQTIYGDSTPLLERTVIGYEASHTLTVRVEGIDKAGPLLDQAVAAGATVVQSLRLQADIGPEQFDKARKEAVADAYRKARLYAEAAGAKLGPVVSLSEEADFIEDVTTVGRRFAATPIEAGERASTLRVHVSYELAPQP